jgi:hypothetical protein
MIGPEPKLPAVRSIAWLDGCRGINEEVLRSGCTLLDYTLARLLLGSGGKTDNDTATTRFPLSRYRGREATTVKQAGKSGQLSPLQPTIREQVSLETRFGVCA